MVKVFNTGWEPRDFHTSHLCDFLCYQIELSDCFLHIFVYERTLDVNEEVNLSLVVINEFGGFRLDSSQIYIVCG